MKLIEVKDAQTKKAFLHLPLSIYKDDSGWIRPLDKDVETVFDPQSNPCFEHGELIRWILEDSQGKIIGRVAAFYDKRTVNAGNEQPTGGLGFFDCIDDKEAAFVLFKAAEDWLKSKGMEAMDGPINFGDRARWWGLLIKDFTNPNYCTNYNPPYYQQLFESYGFKDYFQQYTYRRLISGPKLGDSFYAKAERVRRNESYSFSHIQKKKLPEYAEQFRAVYNASWVKHTGVAEMEPDEAQKLMAQLKPVIDERLIWFAYYNDTPIAFIVMIPELNQLFKYVNGKLNVLGKLKFVYHRWRGHGKKILGLVVGVIPRFHGRGLESALIAEFSSIAYGSNFSYEELEFNWVGDFHPTMMHMYENLLAEISKVHITYRKLFDETKEFKRHPVIK
jgi:GNAT superfamily N-acetyltransferase